jgi:hypothetical protein
MRLATCTGWQLLVEEFVTTRRSTRDVALSNLVNRLLELGSVLDVLATGFFPGVLGRRCPRFNPIWSSGHPNVRLCRLLQAPATNDVDATRYGGGGRHSLACAVAIETSICGRCIRVWIGQG